MKPQYYRLLERCVYDGAMRGIYRAEKYEAKSDEERAEMIQDAIMLEITEWFTFTDEQLGIPSDEPQVTLEDVTNDSDYTVFLQEMGYQPSGKLREHPDE